MDRDTNFYRKLAVRYKIDEELLKKYYDLSLKFEIHLYDVVTLYNIYSDDVLVMENAWKYKFNQKMLDWYDGKFRMSNADRLRPAAVFYEEHGVYTLHARNTHPNSEYMKFWKEEKRRSLYGYHTGSDWISGYNYFYNNYSPIITIKQITETQGERIESFPYIWDSDYFYYHYLEECERTGNDASVLKARGRGYSFKGGSMLMRNYFHIPKSRSMVFVEDKQYLVEDGILTKSWDIMTFVDEKTAWAKRRSKKSTDLHRRASMEVTNNGVKSEVGYLSEVIGVSLKDNPHKSRGKRCKLILYEEAGSFKNLITTWEINNASVKQHKLRYGMRIAFGTGGEEGSGFDGLKELFFKPEGNSVLGVPDVWDPNARMNKVGYFVPEFVNLEGFYDKDGNSDMTAAKEELLKEREALVKAGASSTSMARKRAERPMNPHEAVLRTEGSPFPVIDLREHLIDIRTKSIYKGAISVGNLIISGEGDVKWIPDMTGKLQPITKLETTDVDRAGCVQIFRHPERDLTTGNVQEGIYIAGTDPIDFDSSEVGDKYSLGSTFVMNVLTEQIVAEYTGRPDRADDYYETVRRLCLYYNCQVMYENSLKGMYVYFSNKHSDYLLAEKPKILEDTLQFTSKSNRKKGYIPNARVNALGREWIAKWLRTSWVKDDKDLCMMHTILSEGLMEELINWYNDGNFDRVSAMIALMIYKSDVYKVTEKMTQRRERGGDSFWRRTIEKQKQRYTF